MNFLQLFIPDPESLFRSIFIFGVNIWIQSAVLIACGITASFLCRRKGPALQSLILKMTLVAVVITPLVSHFYGRLDQKKWTIQLSESNHPSFYPDSRNHSTLARPATATITSETASRSSVAVEQSSAAESEHSVSELTVTAKNIDNRIQFGSSVYAGFAWIWLSGTLIILIRLAISYLRMAKLRSEALPANIEIQQRCRSAATEIGIEPPQVLVHSHIRSPLLVGLTRPAILLPSDPAQQEQATQQDVLIHEAAHLARFDCLWHLVAHGLSALLFFQPLVWMLSRRIEETAEDVCDNYVVRSTKDRKGYANRLVTLAEEMHAPMRALKPTALGVVAFKSSLGQRVVRILDGSRNLSVTIGLKTLVGIVVPWTCLIGLTGFLGIALAQDNPPPEFPTTPMAITTIVSGDATDWITTGILSPDETKIAYTEWSITGGSLKVKDLMTGKITTVKKPKFKLGSYGFALVGENLGAWSPDSTRIAFNWYLDEDNSAVIIASLDGDEKELKKLDGNTDHWIYDWSQDSRYLLCSVEPDQGSSTLGLMSIDTGEVQDWGITGNHPQFSPDGKFICFSNGDKDRTNIFVFDLFSLQLSQLTDHTAADTKPVWSADGRFVLL